MAAALKPEWTRPGVILFASELPTNEKAFAYALAEAEKSGAELVILHVVDTLRTSSAVASGIMYYDYEAAASEETRELEPRVARARAAGVRARLVMRPGLPADQILAYAQEHPVGRIVMGTHSPGPVSKLLVGSVAEAVLRNAAVPVLIVGQQAADGADRNFEVRTVLCAVSFVASSGMVAQFAAEVAERHGAQLILQHVIQPQNRREALAGRTMGQLEGDLLALIPGAHEKVEVQAIVVTGDPAQELLYQSRAQQADLIVMGAHGASAFAAATRNGVVYKVLAHAHCPVITLSPCLLESGPCGPTKVAMVETYLAGVI